MQADTAAWAGLETLIDQIFGVDLAQSFERESRAGAVAQQRLLTGSVVGLDAHAGVETETNGMIPGSRILGKVCFEQTAPLECAQQSAADLTQNIGQLLGAKRRHFVKSHRQLGLAASLK